MGERWQAPRDAMQLAVECVPASLHQRGARKRLAFKRALDSQCYYEGLIGHFYDENRGVLKSRGPKSPYPMS